MSNFLNFNGNQGMSFKTFTASGTSYTLDKSASTNSVLVSVGGVMQQPGVDYTVSGTTLTSTSAWTSGVQVDTYIIHKPGTAPTIQDNSIDSDHYVDGSIDTAHIAANQIDGTLTKDALIADYSDVTITAADLIMYGDATDSNNTKRDTVQGILDLVTSGLGNYGFYAQRTSNQSITQNVWTKVTFDTETYDPQSDYDNSSNYRFTPTSAGYYWCTLSAGLSGTSGEAQMRIDIYRNGSTFVKTNQSHGSSGYGVLCTVSAPILFNGSSDYIEGYIHHNGSGASNIDDAHFAAWKIGVS